MKFKKTHRHSVENIEKRKKSNRKVLSYEDMPLEEYKSQTVEISKPAIKRILIVVAIIVALGLIVFAIANRDNLTPEKIGNWIKYDLLGSHDTGYPAEIIGTSVSEGNFISDGGVSYVSDTAYVSLSSTGNELCYARHSFSKPIMATGGDNVIVYNLGGNSYSLGNKKELSDPITTKGNKYIIAADINSEGYYCVVTQADGYLSKVFVYNKDNEQVFAYSFSKYYINAIAINSNGTGCVACGVSGDSGSLSGVAYVLDFTSEEPSATFSLDENMVYSVKYLSSKKVCMVCSNSSYMLDLGSGSLNQVDYGNMELTAYDINQDTDTLALSLSRSGDGRLCSIEYIDNSGQILNVNDTKRSIESLGSYKNQIAVLDSGTCYLFDNEGNRLGKSDAGNGAKAVRLDDTDKAYVLGINEIRKLEDFK